MILLPAGLGIYTTMSSSLPNLGDAYKGGYFAGQLTYPGGVFNIIVAPSYTETTRTYRDSLFTDPTFSYLDGYTNSNNINDITHSAARYCRALTTGGYTDWYLPAAYELELLYYNFKPTIDSNVAPNLNNPYAVPPRYDYYTSNNPTKTIFPNGNFISSVYWTSTQSDASTDAYIIDFTNGIFGRRNKTLGQVVRAIRKEPA